MGCHCLRWMISRCSGLSSAMERIGSYKHRWNQQFLLRTVCIQPLYRLWLTACQKLPRRYRNLPSCWFWQVPLWASQTSRITYRYWYNIIRVKIAFLSYLILIKSQKYANKIDKDRNEWVIVSDGCWREEGLQWAVESNWCRRKINLRINVLNRRGGESRNIWFVMSNGVRRKEIIDWIVILNGKRRKSKNVWILNNDW